MSLYQTIISLIIVENFICIFVFISADNLTIQWLITNNPSCKTTTAIIITSIVKCVKIQIAIATHIIIVVAGTDWKSLLWNLTLKLLLLLLLLLIQVLLICTYSWLIDCICINHLRSSWKTWNLLSLSLLILYH